MKSKSKNIRLFSSELYGIALDWALGDVFGFKIKLLKADERINGKPCICRYVSNDSPSEDVINLPKLIPFRPTEDWELLPDDYKESYDYVEYSTLTTKGAEGEASRDVWLAVKEVYDDGEYIEDNFFEGATKLEAVCKAYVANKKCIIDIPEEVINCM